MRVTVFLSVQTSKECIVASRTNRLNAKMPVLQASTILSARAHPATGSPEKKKIFFKKTARKEEGVEK